MGDFRVMSSRPYIRVAAVHGEALRQSLIQKGLLDVHHRIISEDRMLFFPLSEEVEPAVFSEELRKELSTGERLFEPISDGPRTLTEALQDRLPPALLELVPRAYDLIGDIAVLEIPDELHEYSKTIGLAFHDVHGHFKTVLAKRGAVSGTTRIRQYELLWGEDTTRTVHIEYGCLLAVDLEKAYFSPRLLEEHNRIANLVQPGELVVDMFCGVGPFAIHICRKTDAQVIAVDVNPNAISLLRESLALNKLVGEVTPVVADVSDYLRTLEHSADRVIMNHPSGAEAFVSDACKVLRAGGVIHYYDFIGGDNPEGDLRRTITELIERADRRVRGISLLRRVRDSAPYEYQMVADVVID
jgi:tRNA (guanine37-N1)-methyltransferase